MKKHVFLAGLLAIGAMQLKAQNTWEGSSTSTVTQGKVGIGTTPSTLLHAKSPSGELKFDNDQLTIWSNSGRAELSFANELQSDFANIYFDNTGSGINNLTFEVLDDESDHMVFNHRHWNYGTFSMLKLYRNEVVTGKDLRVTGKAKFSDAMTVDWTHETNWGGSANKWAGYIGFNAYRNDEDQKDFYKGHNSWTNKAVFEGGNSGFRWLYRKNVVANDAGGQHQLNQMMRLTENGQLLIGTNGANGNYKLFVKGGIRTEEVKIDIASENGWADYVFADDYELRSLEEVEDFVQENKHLPGIPSAEEVVAEGVSVAEMQAKLLEKIEELTLYTIDLQKQLKEQQAVIQDLQEEQTTETSEVEAEVKP